MSESSATIKTSDIADLLFSRLNGAVINDEDVRALYHQVCEIAPDDDRLQYFDFIVWGFLLFVAMLALRESCDEAVTNTVAFKTYMRLVDTRPTKDRRDRTAQSLDRLLNSSLRLYGAASDPEAGLRRVAAHASSLVCGSDRCAETLAGIFDRFGDYFRRAFAEREIVL